MNLQSEYPPETVFVQLFSVGYKNSEQQRYKKDIPIDP